MKYNLSKLFNITLICAFVSINTNAQKWVLKNAISDRDSILIKNNFSYDDKARLALDESFYSYNDENWTLSGYKEYNYKDSTVTSIKSWNNNRLESTESFEYNNNLLTAYKIIYSTDSSFSTENIYNKNDSILEEIFTWDKNKIPSKTKNVYNYRDDTLNSINYQIYNFATDIFENKSAIKINYKNGKLSDIIFSKYENNQENNQYGTSFFYNQNGDLYSETRYAFVNDSTIKNKSRIIYKRSPNSTIITYQYWYMEFWRSAMKTEHFNIVNNNRISTIYLPNFNKWLEYYHIDAFKNENNLISRSEIVETFWSEGLSPIQSFLPSNYYKFYGNNIEYNYSKLNTHEDNNNEEDDDKVVGTTVFPNPSPSGIFYVNSNIKFNSYEVYSSAGVLLKKTHLDSQTNIIDISSFHSGIYYVRLMSSEICKTIKLIKTQY